MRALLRCLWLCGGCAIAGAQAATAAPPNAEDLAALLDAAGLERHLEEWPEANALARERAEASLDADVVALLMHEVAAAFAATALRQRVESRLAAVVVNAGTAASLRDGYAQTGSAGLLGPPGGFTVADLRDFPAFASSVSRRRIDPARLALAGRIDAATGFGRNAWRVTGAWGAAVERGARALRCEGASAWESPLSPEASAERRHLAEPFRERVHLELLFAMRTHVSPDLQRSAGFLESEPAREFHAAVAEAVVAAIAGAHADLRARLTGPVARHCGGPDPD